VTQVDEDLQTLANDVVRRFAVYLGDEADSARVVFICRVIETLRWG
jgi:hypothetical protein